MSQDPSIVRLFFRVVAEGIQGSRKPGKAAIFTKRIGLMIGAQSQRQRQVGTGVPFLLAVKTETIESEMIPSRGRKRLLKQCEIHGWIGWVYSSVEECTHREGKQ